jgi:choline kinase
MIGVILAAGKGSRLGNYTTELPKSLLPLNENKTLLDYNIDTLEKLGVSKIFVVTGFQSDKIVRHLNDRPRVEFILNPFWDYCNVLGSLYMALPYIQDDFLFAHADTLVEMDVWEKLVVHEGSMVLPYTKKVCGEEEMKVRLDRDGNLLAIDKIMDSRLADGEFLGIAKFSKETLRYILDTSKTLFTNGVLNHYMEAVVQIAIDEGKDVRSFDIGSSRFIEVDFEEDYITAKNLFGKN